MTPARLLHATRSITGSRSHRDSGSASRRIAPLSSNAGCEARRVFTGGSGRGLLPVGRPAAAHGGGTKTRDTSEMTGTRNLNAGNSAAAAGWRMGGHLAGRRGRHGPWQGGWHDRTGPRRPCRRCRAHQAGWYNLPKSRTPTLTVTTALQRPIYRWRRMAWVRGRLRSGKFLADFPRRGACGQVTARLSLTADSGTTCSPVE
jgi:hypothetical protein